MTKSRLFQIFACLAIVAFFAIGQRALAEENHQLLQLKVVPRANAGRDTTFNPEAAMPKSLFGIAATFAPYALDSSGADEWPCFGGDLSLYPDCPGIAPEGVVVGRPSYGWALSACDSNTNGTTFTSYVPCGQMAWWYEDDTADTTDDLVSSWVVTQGTTIIADSGLWDLGPNRAVNGYGNVFYKDQSFGGWTGSTVGLNNGNCNNNYNYPQPGSTPSTLTYPFRIEANKHCSEPTASTSTATQVKIVATTELLTPTWNYITGKVHYAPAAAGHSIKQTWYIWLF